MSCRVVLLGLAAGFAACRASSAPATIRVGHESDLISLDPVAVSEAATHSILSNIFESLVAFDRDMRLRPALAVSWSTLDERTWLVRLREGVRFHDGRLLSAEDVKFTLDRVGRDPVSGVRGQVWSLKAVEVMDGLTLRLSTVRPDPLLMTRLTYVLVVPRSSGGDPARLPVGTGPYRFVRWEKGRFLEAEAFAGYWGGRPPIDRALFVPVEGGDDARVQALREGLDVVRDLPETRLREVESIPGLRVVARAGLASNYLWWNTQPRIGQATNPFSDRRVRQAVSLALDRARIVLELGGRGVPADQLVQRGVFGHVESLPPLGYDPERARALLKEAGYGNGFDATLAFSGPWGEAAGERIRAMLGDVAIRLRLEKLDWAVLVARWKAAELPFFLSGWRFENADATSFLRDCLYTRDAARGYGSFNPGFSSPALDRLIDENDQIFGEPRRLKQYEALMALALDEMPLVPLYDRANLYAVSARVRWEPRLDGKLLVAEMSLAPR